MLMLQYVYREHRDELNSIWLTFGNSIRLQLNMGGDIVAERRYIAPWWSSDNPTCQKLVHTTAEGGMCICLHDQGTLHQIEGRPLIPKSVFVESLPKLDDGGKGPAEAAGIKIGDRIVSVQVGSLPVTLVTSTNDVVKAMKSTFLSSPFFMTRRAACTSVQDVKDYDNACNILQEMLSVGRRGKVRQIIRGDEMISEVEFFGGDIAGAMVSVANIRRSSNWKSSWDIFLKSFQVKGINDGPLVRQLVQIKGPIGMKIPIAVMHTTYCDDTLRIARDQSGNAFVFGRVSSLTEATDYTTIARETAKVF